MGGRPPLQSTRARGSHGVLGLHTLGLIIRVCLCRMLIPITTLTRITTTTEGQCTATHMAASTYDCHHTTWHMGRQMVVYRPVCHGTHAGCDCLDVRECGA